MSNVTNDIYTEEVVGELATAIQKNMEMQEKVISFLLELLKTTQKHCLHWVTLTSHHQW